MPARNVFHTRAQFLNVEQEDKETLEKYWKRLVDIERKCEFIRITPEEIITYKFAATINDKKTRDKFIRATRTTNRLGNHRIGQLQQQLWRK